MIDEITKQRILDAANIVDVVSDFVALRKSGANYVGLCPFHSERHPSFHVSPSKNICKCFSCNEGGTPVSFLMKLEKMTFTEALRYLARKYNIEIEELEETEEERRKHNEQENMYLIQKFASSFFHEELLHSEEGKIMALPYLLDRGITMVAIEKFALGYAPSAQDALLQKAQSEGYNPQHLYATGLCFAPSAERIGRDRFRERIIFPIHSISGRVVAFGGRIMVNKEKTAKYINSPENAIYSKSRELYGLFFAKNAITKANKVFLVEGYMDVIAMHQAGIENVVASSGTALTVQQIRIIRRFTQNITVLFDGDAAGIKAAIRGVDLLLEAGMHIRVLVLPPGEDPDSFVHSHSVSEFEEYIQQNEVDFITFKTELSRSEMKESPIKKAEVINSLVHSIGLIPDVVERSVYTQSVAQNLYMDEKMLMQQVKISRGKHYAQQTSASITPREEEEEPNIENENTTSQEDNFCKKLSRTEEDLLRIIIRFGDINLPIKGEDGETFEMPIARYILESLDREQDEGEVSLFSMILDETKSQLQLNEHFRPTTYFPNHEYSPIAALALNLLSDRYQLTSASRKSLNLDNEDEMPDLANLIEETIRCIKAYEADGIQQQIQKCHQRIQELQRENESEELMVVMKELSELNKIKMQYARELGTRTILG